MPKLATTVTALALALALPGMAAAKPVTRHHDPIAHMAKIGQLHAHGVAKHPR